MKKLLFLLPILLFVALQLHSQKSSIMLTFEADNNGTSVNMDSLKIQNLTQNGEIMLYDPVTNFELIWSGFEENHYTHESMVLSANYPNPFNDMTNFEINLKKNEEINIVVYNLLGVEIATFHNRLEAGHHQFSFEASNAGYHILTISGKNQTQSISMICQGAQSTVSQIHYHGIQHISIDYKSLHEMGDFPFSLGDQLLFVGYTENGESGLTDTPNGDTDYSIQFATNIPCIEQPVIDYGGQIYNTIQIYNQCWMKENLNIGTMIYAPEFPTNNDTIEKYCFDNSSAVCDLVGGLYYWSEAMAYKNVSGARGICPEGWHIPEDMDWKILEGAADSDFGIGDPEWSNLGWRGTDAGGALKQTGTSLWVPPNTGATDLFGFSAVPGGYFVQGDFWGGGY